MTEKLKREVFETSRVSEYFTDKEMRAQIGYSQNFWPIAILRELIDNALDACEAAGVPPVIEVTVENDVIAVDDNGGGIPDHVVKRSMDYLYRVSDKAYYIAPTRGQMGNALKVIYAAPYVMTGHGHVEIIAQRIKHHITVKHDRITGQPDINYETSAFVKNGTFVKIQWENSTRLLFEPEVEFYTIKPPTPAELISGYAVFNPHATFILNGDRHQPTNTAWEKWRPDMPTSAHWYNTETLRDLIAGYLAKERNNGHQKTIREFVSEFRGLAGTAKQKKVAGNYARETITMFEQGGDIDTEKLGDLLAAMQKESKPPKPKLLGVIGQEHITRWLINKGASENSIRYSKRLGFDERGMPFVFEHGFAINNNDNARHMLVVGINWSPVIGSIPDENMRQAVQYARIDPADPLLTIFHISQPRIEFMDRGKTKTQL